MFKTINRKFYAIAIVLILLFGGAYALLAFFSQNQSRSEIRSSRAMIIEKEADSLRRLFFEIRFWEKSIFNASHKDAGKNFNERLKGMKKILLKLKNYQLEEEINQNFNTIITTMALYENNVNAMVQLQTEDSLLATRMNTNYRSLISTTINTGQTKLLKTLFHLNQFHTAYHTTHRESEYQALTMICNALEQKLMATRHLEHRTQGYFLNFKKLLQKDFSIRKKMDMIDQEFNDMSNQLMEIFSFISMASETGLKEEIHRAQSNRIWLDKFFLLITVLSLITLLFILRTMAREIINPIRSITHVVCQIEKGSIETRFVSLGNRSDEIVQLGFSLNNMLDSLEERQTELQQEIKEREKTEKQQQLLEIRLAQAQKLESIGQLAAGIAHEINTPIQYVGDNTRFLGEAFDDFIKALRHYQLLLEAIKTETVDNEMIQKVESVVENADMDYLEEEIPSAIDQTLEGVAHVARIVRSMKEFSHPGTIEKTAVDINHAIENTITVSRNEWKYVAEMETDLDRSLPLVPCLPGEMNQVFLNIIINGAQAIGDVVGNGSENKGVIRISTNNDGDYVEIRIRDTGPGIPEEIQTRIFDPFFTTKEVGKGTGQGLAVSHSVIVKKHQGEISFATDPGKGTTFTIRLPKT
jgi:signal transduction histidine kinase